MLLKMTLASMPWLLAISKPLLTQAWTTARPGLTAQRAEALLGDVADRDAVPRLRCGPACSQSQQWATHPADSLSWLSYLQASGCQDFRHFPLDFSRPGRAAWAAGLMLTLEEVLLSTAVPGTVLSGFCAFVRILVCKWHCYCHLLFQLERRKHREVE